MKTDRKKQTPFYSNSSRSTLEESVK